ncbi:MAG TPA: DMT family transporter [Candidatus Limnocylindrales bacterium]|nr:DMT family transporter [Candidatus Limnocylindrales bacterium]
MNAFASARFATRALARPGGLSDYGKGVVYAVAAGLALGILGPVSNVAYGAGMGSATFAALRATIGAVAIAVAIRAADHPKIALQALRRRDRVLLGTTAVAQASLSLSLFTAYGAMPVAAVLAVYFCYPLIVAGASIVLGRERLTVARAAGLVVALGGLVAVLLGSESGALSVSLVGVGLAALAATCQAAYLVASRNGFSRVPSDQASALILGGAAVLLWFVAVPVDLAPGVGWLARPAAWLAVAVAGLIGAAFAKVFLLRAVRRIGGTRTSVLLLSEPIVGTVLAALLLGQGVSPVQVLGGVGVLVGAGLAQRPARGHVARKERRRSISSHLDM